MHNQNGVLSSGKNEEKDLYSESHLWPRVDSKREMQSLSIRKEDD